MSFRLGLAQRFSAWADLGIAWGALKNGCAQPSSIPRDSEELKGGGRWAGLGIRISKSSPGNSEGQLDLRTTGLSQQISVNGCCLSEYINYKNVQFNKGIIDSGSIFLT